MRSEKTKLFEHSTTNLCLINDEQKELKFAQKTCAPGTSGQVPLQKHCEKKLESVYKDVTSVPGHRS